MTTLLLFLCYQIISIALIPLVIIFLFIRTYKKKYNAFASQRFGFIPPIKKPGKVIWIHGVSVGEILSVQYFMKMLKKKIPGVSCYLTVGTQTGFEQAQRKIAPDYLSFLPYDFLPCMLLTYKRIKPSALLVLESEIWPNFLLLSKLKKIPLYLLNARIKPGMLKKLTRPLYSCFKKIYCQSIREEQAFQDIAYIPKKKLSVLGNIKAFNVYEKKQEAISYKKDSSIGPILLVGSVHHGECSLYIKLYIQLKKQYPDLKLILAPRHFTWMTQLKTHLKKTNYSWTMWDDAQDSQPLNERLLKDFAKHDIIAVCTLGKLFNLYQFATIYFLGGTFVPVGGHNLLEPAVWGIPTIIGPHHQNCKTEADHLETAGGLIKTSEYKTLEKASRQLLENPQRIITMNYASQAWLGHEAFLVRNNLEKLLRKL